VEDSIANFPAKTKGSKYSDRGSHKKKTNFSPKMRKMVTRSTRRGAIRAPKRENESKIRQ